MSLKTLITIDSAITIPITYAKGKCRGKKNTNIFTGALEQKHKFPKVLKWSIT